MAESKFELSLLQGDRLSEWWPVLEPGIGRAIKKGGARCRPDQVLERGLAGDCLVVMVTEDKEFVGCFVLSQYTELYSGRRVLSVDFAYLEPGVEFLEEAFAEIEELAVSQNIDQIEWVSPRKGWLAKSELLQAEAQYILYAKEL